MIPKTSITGACIAPQPFPAALYVSAQTSPSPCERLESTAQAAQAKFKKIAPEDTSFYTLKKVKPLATSYWDYVCKAARVAKTIGSGIACYGKMGIVGTTKAVATAVIKTAQFVYEETPGVKTLTHAAVHAAVTCSASCYQNIPGAKICAAFITKKALEKLLPQKGILKNQILERRHELDELTKSSICREACRLVASYATAYLQHQILNGEKIEKELRCSFMSALFYDSNKDAKYGFLGDALKLAIQEHPDLVLEIIEANLLKMFSKLVVKLKTAEQENSSWQADLIKEILDSSTKDLLSLKAAEQNPNVQTAAKPFEHDEQCFISHLSKALLKIVLPQAQDDFEIPISGASIFSATLMTELEKSALPIIINTALTELSSDYSRDSLLLKFLQLAKTFFQNGNLSSSSQTKPLHAHRVAPAYTTPYHNQEAFNTSLSAFTSTLFDFLDSKDRNLLKAFHFEKLVGTQGTLLNDVLTQFDILSLCNQGLELLLPLLNAGSWKGEGLYQEFADRPFIFNSTNKDLENENELRKKKHVAVVQQTEALLTTLTNDFSGLTSMGAERVIGSAKPSKDEIHNVLQNGSFLEQCRLCTQLLLLNAIKAILIFICKIFGETAIQKTGYALQRLVQQTQARQAIRPLTAILARKL